jgi:choline dehydrogenase-like flavoprotein
VPQIVVAGAGGLGSIYGGMLALAGHDVVLLAHGDHETALDRGELEIRLPDGTLDPAFNPFDGSYLAEILEATAHAWARMKPPRPNEIEDRITARLVGQLANAPEFAEIPYDITYQWWLLGLEGELLGRLDIRFKHRRSKRDYFGFADGTALESTA